MKFIQEFTVVSNNGVNKSIYSLDFFPFITQYTGHLVGIKVPIKNVLFLLNVLFLKNLKKCTVHQDFFLL